MPEQSLEAQKFQQEKEQRLLKETAATREAATCDNPACIIHGSTEPDADYRPEYGRDWV